MAGPHLGGLPARDVRRQSLLPSEHQRRATDERPPGSHHGDRDRVGPPMMSTVWMPPAPVPRRQSPPLDDVHVWRVPLRCAAGIVERCAGLLSADERERAERFYFERDRRRYVRARAALRAVLGGYLDVD